MIDLRAALDLVEPHLRAVAEQEDMAVVVTAAKRTSRGWSINYNTEEFATTGDPLSGLLGNLAIEVGDDGKLKRD